jgi:hypothetical protein
MRLHFLCFYLPDINFSALSVSDYNLCRREDRCLTDIGLLVGYAKCTYRISFSNFSVASSQLIWLRCT